MIQDLKNYDKDDKIVSFEEMRDIVSKIPPPKFVIKSGIKSLDELCENFEPGELWIISGPEKSGKTLLMQNITEVLSAGELNSLWFSYELTIRKFLEKFDESVVGYLPQHLKDKDMEWVKTRIHEAKQKFDVKVVFIDHLHFLFDTFRSKSITQDIGFCIRELKRIAVELEIVIFMVSHTIKLEDGKEPTENDLRDSGYTSKESDGVIMIWKTPVKTKEGLDYSENKGVIRIQHTRRSGAFSKRIPVVLEYGKFRELLKDERDQTNMQKSISDFVFTEK